jgi:hypothetical protein
VHADEENAVVETVVVVCYESVDVRPLWLRREEDLERDVRIHNDQVAVKPTKAHKNPYQQT